MKKLVAVSVFAVLGIAAPNRAVAQDHSACTSLGYSVGCCAASVKKFGAYGTGRRSDRVAFLQQCSAGGKKTR